MAAFCSSFYTARHLLLACTSESVRRSLGVRAGTRQSTQASPHTHCSHIAVMTIVCKYISIHSPRKDSSWAPHIALSVKRYSVTVKLVCAMLQCALCELNCQVSVSRQCQVTKLKTYDRR